ncbi:hypothetical protein VOLCADRAFT_104933 [Volvox carteri f. nagariensis]|uniref:Uncharacterized protein n=1 Tax=Volvox carteri f. nagariensis TaxID=3068 RepID=D8TX73_VOLCA|nr:uncharacterized protein VOLCADRAFT_104933 [Volvox carteri f. nagariensis]EFJ47961.1 hypothetical protein VOLCADRAFT_104933 [Volvox carteri f. nagariensis]|eukprot:XP_002951067.1 hypothetical protein VOLCADRAFT_104933 [Volvox carteri f. nagariensis]
MSEPQLKGERSSEAVWARFEPMISAPALPRKPANMFATLAEAKSSSTAASILPRRSRISSREDTGEESGEGTDEGGDDVDLYGNLKTTLVWDCTGRRLCLSARQYAESSRKLELKMKGMLDTASGQHRIWGHVRRNFYTHVPLLQRLLTAQSQRQSGGWVDEPDLDPEAWLPGGLRCLLLQDWCIAPGVSYDTARSPPLPPSASASGGGSSGGGLGGFGGGHVGLPALLGQRLRYQVSIKKNPQVIKNGATLDLWVQARALAEFDPKASEVALGASLRLKAVRYGVTAAQDVRLSLGLDVVHNEAGQLTPMPYIHASDGKFGARLQNRRWQITYTL